MEVPGKNNVLSFLHDDEIINGIVKKKGSQYSKVSPVWNITIDLFYNMGSEKANKSTEDVVLDLTGILHNPINESNASLYVFIDLIIDTTAT